MLFESGSDLSPERILMPPIFKFLSKLFSRGQRNSAELY